MNKKFLRLFVSTLVIVGLSSCSTPREDRIKRMSAVQLLEEGDREVKSGNYKSSVDHFNAVEARFPHSSLAEQAKFNKIYALYHDRNFDEALREIDDFMKLYPNHPDIAYAWYMQGLINFDRARSILDKLMPPDRSKIDQQQMTDSLNSFLHILEHYPDSVYADDSAKRVVYLRNTLAESEMHIAEFYFKRKAYVGAANRAQYVLDHYDHTPSLSDALYLQVRAYRELGLTDLAENRLALLRHNFPQDSRLAELN